MSPSTAKSTTIESSIRPIRMHNGVPILEPEVNNAWENKVVLNPAAVLIESGDELDTLVDIWRLEANQRSQLNEAGGACVLVYRAQGNPLDKASTSASYLGLAIFTPDLRLVFRFKNPVLKSDSPWHNLGVEDPRCTKIDDTYYLYYVGYSGELSGAETYGRTQVCLATTTDFISWRHHGSVSGDINDFANKNAALLPIPSNDSWVLLHRPMTGPDAMAIHTATSHHPAEPWKSKGLFMETNDFPEMNQSWIGAGGPPIPTGDGRFVMIYHQGHYRQDGTRLYTLSATLIDFESLDPVKGRIEPLMIPSGPGEQVGDPPLGVNNVLFTCGNYLWKNDLIIPYAAADSRIFGAKMNFVELIEALDATIRN